MAKRKKKVPRKRVPKFGKKKKSPILGSSSGT